MTTSGVKRSVRIGAGGGRGKRGAGTGGDAARGGAQRAREYRGERGQQHPCVRVGGGKMHGAMQRHDDLAGSGRSLHARRAAVAPFHVLPWSRVQKDRPPLPRIFERPAQLLLVGNDAEAALRIGMGKRIPVRASADRPLRRAAGSQFQ